MFPLLSVDSNKNFSSLVYELGKINLLYREGIPDSRKAEAAMAHGYLHSIFSFLEKADLFDSLEFENKTYELLLSYANDFANARITSFLVEYICKIRIPRNQDTLEELKIVFHVISVSSIDTVEQFFYSSLFDIFSAMLHQKRMFFDQRFELLMQTMRESYHQDENIIKCLGTLALISESESEYNDLLSSFEFNPKKVSMVSLKDLVLKLIKKKYDESLKKIYNFFDVHSEFYFCHCIITIYDEFHLKEDNLIAFKNEKLTSYQDVFLDENLSVTEYFEDYLNGDYSGDEKCIIYLCDKVFFKKNLQLEEKIQVMKVYSILFVNEIFFSKSKKVNFQQFKEKLDHVFLGENHEKKVIFDFFWLNFSNIFLSKNCSEINICAEKVVLSIFIELTKEINKPLFDGLFDFFRTLFCSDNNIYCLENFTEEFYFYLKSINKMFFNNFLNLQHDPEFMFNMPEFVFGDLIGFFSRNFCDIPNNFKYSITRENTSFFIFMSEIALSSEERVNYVDNKKSFEMTFSSINKSSEIRKEHYRSYLEFMILYQPIVFQLIQVMKSHAFTFLKRYISETVLKLERLMNNFNILPGRFIDFLSFLFEEYGREIVSEKNAANNFEEIMIVLGAQLRINQTKEHEIKQTDFLTEIQDKTNNNIISLEEIKQQIFDFFYKTIFSSLGIDLSKVDFEKFLIKTPMYYFSKLLIAQIKMNDDEYRSIFQAMLKVDFERGSFDSLIHDVSQNFYFGCQLALHNMKIIQELEQMKINTSLAFNYNHCLSFFYEEKAGVLEFNYLLNAIWVVLKKIHALHDVIVINACINLKQAIHELNKNIKKNTFEEVDITKMASSTNHSLLNKINKIILFSQKNLVFQADSSMLFDEYLSYYTEFSKIMSHKQFTKKELSSVKTFRIIQWDKADIATYWLGDYVSCCLASDGRDFRALVQRRMDDAMFFHTVIEETSGLPIALTWLYFAKDLQNPSNVYVIANFIEMSAKYVLNERMQKTVISGLLSYTEKFCHDVGATAFLLSPLDHGRIKNFTCFEKRRIIPEKIGGCLNLTNNPNMSVKEHYYLTSLDCREFHLYDPEKMPPDRTLWKKSAPQSTDAVMLKQLGVCSHQSENRPQVQAVIFDNDYIC